MAEFTIEELRALREMQKNKDPRLTADLIAELDQLAKGADAPAKAPAVPVGAPPGEPAPVESAPPAAGKRELTRLPYVTNPMTRVTDLALSYVPESVKRIGSESGLSTVGGMVGAGVGALGGPLAPATVPLGEALGSMSGEAISQALGISPPSMGQIIAAGAAPPLVRGAVKAGSAVVRSAARNWPGAAPVLHDIAVGTAKEIPDVVRPTVDPETLWKPVRMLNPKMLMSQFSREVDGALRDATTGLKGAQVTGTTVRRLKALQEELAQYGDDVPFRVMDKSRQLIGAWTRSSDENLRTLGKRLYGPIMDDYTANAALGGTPQRVKDLLDPAIKATRAQKTAERLEEIVQEGLTRSGKTGEQRVRAGAIIKDILDDADVVKRLSPSELADIKSLLNRITGLPADLPVGGVQHGSGPAVRWGAAGSTVGGFLAGPEGIAVGGTMGAWAPVVLSKLVATGSGRAALKKALDAEGGELTMRALMTAAQAIRGELPIPEGEPVRLGPVQIGTRARIPPQR